MCEGWRLIIWLVSLPRWVVIIMYIEYIPVIIMLIPIRIMVKFDQENNDMVMNNSPILPSKLQLRTDPQPYYNHGPRTSNGLPTYSHMMTDSKSS